MIVVHAGFARTGTSTLQRRVFGRHPQINFLGLPAANAETDWAIRQICQADSIYYREDVVHQILDDCLKSNSPSAVVSYEQFALYEAKDKGMVAQRLRRLFPDARIMFTIRRQEDLVKSLYLNNLNKYIKRKNFISFEDWFVMASRESYRSILDDLRYFSIVEAYAKLFGRDNIGLFMFEEMKRQPRHFAEKMAAFLEVDSDAVVDGLASTENAAMSERQRRFWMRFGPFLPRRVVRNWSRRVPSRGGEPARIEIGDTARRTVAEIVADENRRLAEAYGIDLEGHGYTVATAP